MRVIFVIFLCLYFELEASSQELVNSPGIKNDRFVTIVSPEVDSVDSVLETIVRYCIRQLEPDSAKACKVSIYKDTIGNDSENIIKGLKIAVCVCRRKETLQFQPEDEWDYAQFDSIPIYIKNTSGQTFYKLKSPVKEIRTETLLPNIHYYDDSFDEWTFLVENDKVYLLYNWSRDLLLVKYEMDFSRDLKKPEYFNKLHFDLIEKMSKLYPE